MRSLAAHQRERQCATGRRDRRSRARSASRACACSASQASEIARARRAAPAPRSRGSDLEAAALAHACGCARGAAPCARRPRARSRERHARLFAELVQRETEIEVERQVVRAHLVEDGAPAVAIGELAEAPGQLAALRGRADGSPIAIQLRPCDAVHQEAVAVVVDEQLLVAEQRQVRAARCGAAATSGARARARRARRQARRGARAGAAARASAKRASSERADAARAASASACAGELELPPQLVRVLDVAVRRAATTKPVPTSTSADAGGPAGENGLREQRAAPVEEAAAGQRAPANIAARSVASS